MMIGVKIARMRPDILDHAPTNKLFPIGYILRLMDKPPRIIKPSSTHFISKEGARHFGIPVFKTRDEEGEQVIYAAFEGQYYKMQRTIKPFPSPIPYSGSDER
jgi:hypothetical protein